MTPMQRSTDPVSLPTLEASAPSGTIRRSTVPTVYARRGVAGNDATHAEPACAEGAIESWARHALAANGFGDGMPSATEPAVPALPAAERIADDITDDPSWSKWPSRYEMFR